MGYHNQIAMRGIKIQGQGAILKLEQYKRIERGSPGGSVVWRLTSARGMILETWDQVPCQAPCMEPASLPLPLPVSLPLSLSVSIMNK